MNDRGIMWVLSIVSGVSVASFLVGLFTIWMPAVGGRVTDLGDAANAIGPLGASFSAVAMILAFVTVHFQRQEMKEQQKESKVTKRVLRAQAAGTAASQLASFSERLEAVMRGGYGPSLPDRLHNLPTVPFFCEEYRLFELGEAARHALLATALLIEKGGEEPYLSACWSSAKRNLEEFNVWAGAWYLATLDGVETTPAGVADARDRLARARAVLTTDVEQDLTQLVARFTAPGGPASPEMPRT